VLHKPGVGLGSRAARAMVPQPVQAVALEGLWRDDGRTELRGGTAWRVPHPPFHSCWSGLPQGGALLPALAGTSLAGLGASAWDHGRRWHRSGGGGARRACSARTSPALMAGLVALACADFILQRVGQGMHVGVQQEQTWLQVWSRAPQCGLFAAPPP